MRWPGWPPRQAPAPDANPQENSRILGNCLVQQGWCGYNSEHQFESYSEESMDTVYATRGGCVARDRGPAYDAAPPTAARVVAALTAGADALAGFDPQVCSDEELGAVLLAAEAAQRRIAAHQATTIRAFDQRDAARHDACVTTAGWLRLHTTMGPGAAKKRVKRAYLLQAMTHLRAAYEEGAVATEQVDAIVYRAIPSRAAAIAEHDDTLAQLARNAEPREVAVAVTRIIDTVDRDGTDNPPPCANDDLRGIDTFGGYAGLSSVRGSTTTLLNELLARTFRVFDTPDPADTPVAQRRGATQRRHDALQAALATALDHHPGATIDGVKTHASLFVDLRTMLGDDDLATIRPRLGETGVIDAETARHIIATTNPTLRLVLGLGPWLPITVSRTRRVLPQWLRGASQLAHQHCVGPGCDVKFSRCEADHREPHCNSGATALFNDNPLCPPHNQLKHDEQWTLTFDVDTGVTTWTSADATRVIRVPPAEP
ncbi:MAG: DUF222 domain-containing protein [Nitriliruptorales bacterium]|nr:DUF222 domain-containing protein [Nitriliruptorales bacterium]